ncbi:MAG: LysR family transcriptional regulator [Gammaproteobacteria bacterium CG_4_10_14_0_8_um_filter_38_16]|nr:MAG: LysR family transcriptional regulator [Gammaproteobacteria bacterium CG_4_10_14_0_8_um_filter_38_16]PJA03612.1 MAG: LysR family transcriptional regulator [Gammaproteobacteria bacterium CG_4_10_14_0_2_um_filter_38_22]
MSLLSPNLIAFMAIVKHKTVHGAADAIHLTQTAVTQRIRSLEKQLKTTLFVRTRRGMVLTQEGEALWRYCMAAKSLEGEALARIQKTGTETEIELTISAPASMMHSRVLPACLPIMEKFPNLLMHFDVDDIDERHEKLRAGLADLVVLRDNDLRPEMQHKVLHPEEYVLVGSVKWKGRRLRDIIKNERIIDFDQTDTVTFDYLKQHGLFDQAQHSRYFANRTDNMALMVANGIGYTTLAKEFAKPYVDSNALIILNQAKTLNISQVLAWFDRPEPPKYFSAVVKAIT